MDKIINEIKSLAETLELPAVVTEETLIEAGNISVQEFEQYSRELLAAHTAKATAKKVDEIYKKNSFSALAIYLYTASLCWERIYQPLNIPRKIYLDTMGAFSRFIQEYFRAAKVYRFDRGFWIWRYLSGLIFRIGELEYELTKFPANNKKPQLNGKESLSIHIPSDANLSPSKVKDSYQKAVFFFELYFPNYHYRAIYTDTWLLSPNLAKWLKQDSKIRQFSDDYQLLTMNKQDNSGVPWIFKRVDAEIQNYPEETSLQRQAKKHLLAGKYIGSGLGILFL